jgi:nitroimidazol reductase NimA-like FMN-containing flavoprotein (pyridoxamine 5'-phosphate oxidase superfamily)
MGGRQSLEELSVAECWRLLRTVAVGRVAIPTSRGGVEIFPVNHAVDHGSIVFRTALGTKLTTATEAAEVAFEADNAALGLDQQLARGDDPWSVVVHGSAKLITLATGLFDSFELTVQPWHDADKPYFIRIVPTVVSGRRIRIDS